MLLEAQLKSLKVVLGDAERRQAATEDDAKQDMEMKRQLHEISDLKQQVVSFATTEPYL